MRKYEVVLLLNPELSTEALSSELSNFEDLLKKFDGKILEKQEAKLIAMGYKIKKHKNAHYVLLQVELQPSKLQELDKLLKLQNSILRYTFIVKKDKKQVAI